MIIKNLNNARAKRQMDQWKSTNKLPELVDNDYLQIRNDLTSMNIEINELIKRDYSDYSSRKLYLKDILLGLKLYEYFNQCEWFNQRVASNYDFWRFLSIMVVPNVVQDRWDFEDSRYWKQKNRMWLPSIWWYANLCFNENYDNTLEIMLSKYFTTDTILNLVDRTGKKGFDIELYRRLMHKFSLVNPKKYSNVSNKLKKSDNVFRLIMRLHTARSQTIDPNLYKDGLDGYIINLFESIGLY